MSSSKKIIYHDDIEYDGESEYSEYNEFSISKKKTKLDPYDKNKERRNSKINPRFISLDDDEV